MNLWMRSACRSQRMLSENTFNLLNETHSISNSDWNNSKNCQSFGCITCTILMI